ncbi:MAG: hypothetical protein U0640_14775 [Phycisphaerales bacterium]
MVLRIAAIAFLVFASIARGQSCTAQWLSGQIPSPNGPVRALTLWDRDGAGPQLPVLVVGGSFTLVGTLPVNNLAAWDGIAWSDIGGGVTGTIHGTTTVLALAVMGNGDLVVGGQFDNAGLGANTIVANCIARYNGTSWHRMGQGAPNFFSSVLALSRRPSGDLFGVGGEMVNDDNTLASGAIRWNEATSRWQNVGSTPPNIEQLRTVLALSNGEVVFGGVQGNPPQPGSSAAWRWSDSQNAWLPFGSGVGGTHPRNQVFSVLEASNGDIVLAGNFTVADGVAANSIARWNGSQFFAYGSGITYPSQPFQLAVRALAQMPNGDIVAGGQFDTAGGNVGGRIARWDGATWTRLPQGAGDIVWALLLNPYPNELMIGGQYTFAGGSFSNKYIARYVDMPVPWTATQPAPTNLCDASTAFFTAAPARGALNASFRWQRNGVDVSDGPGGASASGGVVTGSSGTIASPTIGTPITLIISNAQTSDSGSYTIIFTNPCGSSTSQAAIATISTCGPTCDSIDFNNDTSSFDPQDIDAFLSTYGEGPCIPESATCNDIDFNNDGSLFDPCDIDSFLLVFSEGPCTPCGG